jgi:hypothetical protein
VNDLRKMALFEVGEVADNHQASKEQTGKLWFWWLVLIIPTWVTYFGESVFLPETGGKAVYPAFSLESLTVEGQKTNL